MDMTMGKELILVTRAEETRCFRCRKVVDLTMGAYQEQVDSIGIPHYYPISCWFGPLDYLD